MSDQFHELIYLSKHDVEAVNLPIEEMTSIAQQVFREKGLGQVEMPPKPGIHPRDDCSIRAMLAFIPSLNAAGVKWISGYAHNFARGIPNINGLIVLNDPETGFPIAIMDCTWITAQRTGASTAVTAKYLAKQNSTSIGFIACGRVARACLKALQTLFQFTTVRAYDIDRESALRFQAEFESQLGFTIEVVDSAQEAALDMDIIISSTPIVMDPRPVVENRHLAPGSLTCALDFDACISSNAFATADLLVTDDIPQFHYFKDSGYFKETPSPTKDLGAIISDADLGRKNDNMRVTAINLGLGILDVSVAKLVYERALDMGIGTRLAL